MMRPSRKAFAISALVCACFLQGGCVERLGGSNLGGERVIVPRRLLTKNALSRQSRFRR